MMGLRTVLMAVLLISNPLVFAAPGDGQVDGPSAVVAAPLNSQLGSGLGSAQQYLVQSMLMLGGLLIVLMVAIKLLRKSGHLKNHAGQRLKVVEAVSLGGSDRAVLLRVGNEELLLGVSQGRVVPLILLNADASSTLATPEPSENDTGLNRSDLAQTTASNGFSQLLTRLRG